MSLPSGRRIVTSPNRRLNVALRAARPGVADSSTSRVAAKGQAAVVFPTVPPPAKARSCIMRVKRWKFGPGALAQ